MTRRSHGDEGAVAVMVAILALVIVGMAAFALDFGNAYAVKRKLSVAADAASLAAAADVGKVVLTQATGCSGGILLPAAAQTAAKSVAESTARTVDSQNDLSGAAVVSSVDVTCTGADVRVSVSNTQSVPTFFGGVFGISQINPSRSATARVFAPTAPGGLRPIAACASTVNHRYNAKTGQAEPFLVFMDKSSLGIDSGCPKNASGQWDIVNFLDQGVWGTFSDPFCPNGGSSVCQAHWMKDGYPGQVFLKDPQAYVVDPTKRTDSADPGLRANSGAATSIDFRNAIDAMPGKVVQIPIVDWLSSDKVAGKKVGDRFGLTGVMTVRVCASIDEQNLPAIPNPSPVSGDCGGFATPDAPGSPYTAEAAWWNGTADPTNKRYALWVQPLEYIVSGVSGGPRTDCSLYVNTCANGTLAVQLYN